MSRIVEFPPFLFKFLLLFITPALWSQSYGVIETFSEQSLANAIEDHTILPDQFQKFFYEPYPLSPGASVFQLGGSFSMLPAPITEQEIPFPALDIQYKRGIYQDISWVGSISTSIFSNLVHTGIQWNTNFSRLSLGIASHVGIGFGFVTQETMFENVQAHALFYMPIIRVGYRFDDFSLSSSLVATYIFNSVSYVNNLKASLGPEKTINDLICTLAVEQPFVHDLMLSLGFSMGFTRTPYQSWMLYNTLDEWLFVPEFLFAFPL